MTLITKPSVTLIVICSLILASCSQFSSTRRLDMAPFGENTSVTLEELKEGLVIKRAVLTAPYLHGETVSQLIKKKNDIGTVLNVIVFYSTQLVNISRSQFTDQEKSKLLAEYITKLASPVVEARDPDIRISKEKFDTMVHSIESQPNMLAALGAAQPLINAVARYVNNTLDELNDLAIQIAAETTSQIEQNFSDVIQNKNSLEAMQTKTIKSFYLLSKLRDGESGARSELLANDPALKNYVKSGVKMKSQDFDQTEKEIMQRFNNTQIMLDKLYPRLDEYHAQIRELDELMHSFEENAKKLRMSVSLWSRSHANLAAGIEVPPAIDIGGMLSGATQKVIP